jgi:Concanavalin A-like lectin/glucanases superfamily
MNPRRHPFIACAVVAAALAAAATAQAARFPTYPLGSTPGTWQVDRYPPAAFADVGGFAGRTDVLGLGIAAADSAANRPPPFGDIFYNTQGRGFATAYTAYAVSYGSVYVPAAWASSDGPANNRRTDLWAVISPASGGDTCPSSNCNLFPIIGFTNASPSDPLNAGGTGRLRVFDGNGSTPDGWNDLAAPVVYNGWNDLCTVFDGTTLKSYVNGVLGYTATDLAQGDTTFGPPTQIARTIVEAYNFGGADYTANWADLGSGTLSTSYTLAGGGQTAARDAAFKQALTVTVLDTDGDPLPCVPVTFTPPASGAGANLSALSVLTDRNGVAAVSARANGTLGSFLVGVAIDGQPAQSFALDNADVATGPVDVPLGGPRFVAWLALMLGAAALVTRRRCAR